MSEKRRDNRGRILHNGESQRQDGRAPAGRARDLSLRQKERQIQQDLFNQIVPNGGNMTVLELVENIFL